MKDKRRLLVIITAFILIMVIGVIGYGYLLGIGFIDALYMTVITISTVGFQEVAAMTPEAKLFSVIIIFVGLTFVGYLFTSAASFLLEGSLQEIVTRRRLRSKMKTLENHYILCGAGETGDHVIRQFEKSKVSFIVIDSDDDRVTELNKRGVMAIRADAKDEDALLEAGILKASGLVSSLPTDTDNVFTVLSARYLNSKIYIIARANEEHAHAKLARAGADRTISPSEIGGNRMAALMLRPSVISFLDMITHIGDVALDLEDVMICEGSALIGKSLKEARIPDKTGLIILSLLTGQSGEMIFNPGPDVILKINDAMIVLGKTEQVDILKSLAGDSGHRSVMSGHHLG